MTSIDLSGLIPTKYKAIVSLIGTGLSFIVPLVLNATAALPPPWPAIIGGILWLLTALGVYHAPYLPKGTVIAPSPPAPPAPPKDYQAPWPKP